MAVISYTAKRRLVAGHVAGQDYDIEIDLAAFDKGFEGINTQHRSISGVAETIVQRIDDTADIVTDWMDEWETPAPRKLDCMREFLNSVLGGEEFYIDFEGRIDAPANPVLYELDKFSFREKREAGRYISIPFSVRKVA